MTRSLDSLSFHSGLVFFPATAALSEGGTLIYELRKELSKDLRHSKLFHFAASSSTSIIRPVTTFLTLCDYYAALP
ncbi:hypothetical protein DTO280E4_1174 [Paecilomyces variotii]|nr:hypothetical protein DTO280E4_1174 [Paecilomyces variotii]